jgi:hypothetical protein
MSLAQRIGAQLLLRRRTGGGTVATLLVPAREPRPSERAA